MEKQQTRFTSNPEAPAAGLHFSELSLTIKTHQAEMCFVSLHSIPEI
jgi:S-adenosylmethionine:tRNA-ribosyltransferase-isomerase (queuine synthetase)